MKSRGSSAISPRLQPVSAMDYDRVMDQLSKWEGERRAMGEMAMSDIAMGGLFSGEMVTDRDGRIQGIVSYSEYPDVLYITRIATRGEVPGLGTDMMKTLARRAADDGKGLQLLSTETSSSFYERIGMRDIGNDEFAFTAAEARAFANS